MHIRAPNPNLFASESIPTDMAGNVVVELRFTGWPVTRRPIIMYTYRF
jgi:hypothetical protein